MTEPSAPVALITGASSGIGAATAMSLAKRGFTVYGAARRVDRMADLAAAGLGVLRMDLTDDESTASGVKTVLEREGRIDLLVNNAGYGSYGALEDVDLAEARNQVEVNLLGLARLTQLVLPGMRQRRVGRVINVASVFGRMYGPLGSWYHATKYAVEGLSDALRLEMRPFGVRVVLIEPGSIRTEWGPIAVGKLREVSGGSAYAEQAEAVARFLERVGSPRFASAPELIAETIVRASTAASPRARYVAPRSLRLPLAASALLPDWTRDALMMRLFGTSGLRR